MITAKINVTRIDKKYLFEGKNGKYLDMVLFENKAGPDQYGNDGFITQGISKEAREAGERGPIIGNWKNIVVKPKEPAPAAATPPAEDDDDVPF